MQRNQQCLFTVHLEFDPASWELDSYIGSVEVIFVYMTSDEPNHKTPPLKSLYMPPRNQFTNNRISGTDHLLSII